MYEKPQLIDAGEAKDVIQGFTWIGQDPDGSAFPNHFLFEPDNVESDRN